MRQLSAASAALLFAAVAGCSLLEMGDSRRAISGDYCLEVGSSITEEVITRCRDSAWVIPPNVKGEVSDHHFIIAKWEPDDPLEHSAGDLRWYIIDVQKQLTYGPYTYDQYLEKRTELGVPENLRLANP